MEFDAQQTMESVTELVSMWGIRVVGAITVLIIGRVVAGMVRSALRRGLERSNMDSTLIPFLSGMAYYLMITFVIIAVLGIFGIPTAQFVAVLGAAGLAVGLAMQGTLSNFAAGVMLLIFRPFRVGDYVEAAGTAGSVQSIGVFSPALNTPDNIQIIVPNSVIYGQIIKNYSTNKTRRIDLVVGVSYSDDLGRAADTIRQVLGADPRVLEDPEPTVAVSEMADSSMNIVVRPWCKASDYWSLRCDLTRTLKEQLEAAGCSIPFPQRDVHLSREEGAA